MRALVQDPRVSRQLNGKVYPKEESLMDYCFTFGNLAAERDHAAEVARERAHA